MKKRAQLMSHPFTIILTLIVAAMIIFFGISTIRDLTTLGDKLDISNFLSALQREVATYYTLDIGSRKNLDIPLPREISHICFVDHSKSIDYSVIPGDNENIVKVVTNKNTFFIPYPNQPIVEPINIENLQPETNPLCIKTNSRLIARIESKGTHVSIS